jgi:hypothetical protein
MPVETYDAPDAIPEDVREAAIETKDGKFVVVRDQPVPDVSGLKNKNTELLGKLKKLEAIVEEQTRKASDAELAAKGLLEHKQRWDQEILHPVKSRLDELEAENRQLKLVGPIKDALHKAGAVDADAAWTLEGNRFDLDEQGRPYLKDDPTASIDKWIADQLPKLRPYLFAGTKAGGGGATGAKGGAAVGSAGADPRNWTAIERAEYIEANGVQAFQKLMTAAVTHKK